jgi:plastocyanin
MTVRRSTLLLALALALVAVAALAPGALGTSSAGKVAVSATDFKFKLLPKTATAGVTTFTVVNKGHATHDFKIAGKKTKILNPGKSQKIVVTLKKGRRYPYLCTVPGHAQLGMKGTLVVR